MVHFAGHIHNVVMVGVIPENRLTPAIVTNVSNSKNTRGKPRVLTLSRRSDSADGTNH